MAQAPAPDLDFGNPEALAAADGTTLPAAQKNALSKQYDLSIIVKITESNNSKAYFDNDLKYSGISYPIMVAIEAELLKIAEKATILGAEVATGGAFQPK